MLDLDARLVSAIEHFWLTRAAQGSRQGSGPAPRDRGSRTEVTAGKHLDEFIVLCRDILLDAGLAQADVYCRGDRELPGFFRAEKSWDLIAIANGQLLAAVEFKAQVGPSFGNNFNNRTEEALGNAHDFWTAYRECAFKSSIRPWLGYVFILEDCAGSQNVVKTREPHFPVFDEFRGTSYAARYQILLDKLLRERLYDGASLILTQRLDGPASVQGTYRFPAADLSFRRFAAGLAAQAIAFLKYRIDS